MQRHGFYLYEVYYLRKKICTSSCFSSFILDASELLENNRIQFLIKWEKFKWPHITESVFEIVKKISIFLG